MKALRALGALSLLAAFAAPAHAYFEETVVGARGLALGNSSIAVVSDVTAYYWNPAALGSLRGAEASADFAKPYGLANVSGSAVAVAAKRFGAGWALAWHHLGLQGAYSEDQFTLAAGRRLAEIRGAGSVAGGIAVRSDRIAFESFQDPSGAGAVDYGSRSKPSVDLGLLWSSPWNIDVAYVGRDLLNPHFEFIAGSGGQTIAARQALAAAFHWNRESTLTLGWSQLDGSHSEASAGLEILFYDVFAIRSGFSNLSRVYESLGDPNQLQFTGGFGVQHKGYFVDAAATTNHDLGASYHVTLRVPFGAGERR